MDGDSLVPIIGILFSLGVLPLSILYFINRGHDKKLDTIIKVVELGGTLDPEMMKMLTGNSASYKTDYKYGLIWLALVLISASPQAIYADFSVLVLSLDIGSAYSIVLNEIQSLSSSTQQLPYPTLAAVFLSLAAVASMLVRA